MYKWLKKLEVGKHYEVKILEEALFVAEYRGFDKWEDFVIFWIDGDSKGCPFYLGDIESIKEVK